MGSDKEAEFNEVLVSTIAEALDFSDVILNFLELNSSFKRGGIVQSVDSFSKGLRELFGDSGIILEEIIAKRLYERLSLSSEPVNGSFETKIKHAYMAFKGKKRNDEPENQAIAERD